jgi:hypothetical protein
MKKPVFIVIGAVCLALVFGFFLFGHFFWGATVQVKDVHTQEVLTVKLNKQLVANVRFHVTGKLDGAATLYWNCSDATRQSCRGE